jgi:hypothetical protein
VFRSAHKTYRLEGIGERPRPGLTPAARRGLLRHIGALPRDVRRDPEPEGIAARSVPHKKATGEYAPPCSVTATGRAESQPACSIRMYFRRYPLALRSKPHQFGPVSTQSGTNGAASHLRSAICANNGHSATAGRCSVAVLGAKASGFETRKLAAILAAASSDVQPAQTRTARLRASLATRAPDRSQ